MNMQIEYLYQQIGQKMVDVIGEPFIKTYPDPGASMDRRTAWVEKVLGHDAAIRWS